MTDQRPTDRQSTDQRWAEQRSTDQRWAEQRSAEQRRAPAVITPIDGPHDASAAVAQRTEFVRAFVEHAGARRASERFTVRLPTLITVTALSTVGALVVGVFWSLIKPGSAEQAHAAPATSKPAVSSWSAVAGWDCAAAEDRGFQAQGRTADWRTETSGGWAADGCHRTFETLPIAAKNSRGQGATWWFSPPAGLTPCRVSVFLPPLEKAADKARYSVLSGQQGTSYADFTVDQSRQQNSWVAVGTFPVSNHQIAVGLRAEDSTGPAGGRLAVAQMKVDCGS